MTDEMPRGVLDIEVKVQIALEDLIHSASNGYEKFLDLLEEQAIGTFPLFSIGYEVVAHDANLLTISVTGYVDTSSDYWTDEDIQAVIAYVKARNGTASLQLVGGTS